MTGRFCFQTGFNEHGHERAFAGKFWHSPLARGFDEMNGWACCILYFFPGLVGVFLVFSSF
jgi:hypothetical protein